jgi:hypothetical protein
MSTPSKAASSEEVPDLLAMLLPYFERAAPQEHRMLLAVLERYASEHYQGWAARETDPRRKQGFLDCARREIQIAEIVESLEPNAQAVGDALRARFADMKQAYAEAMKVLSNPVQWKAQAAGERGGAGLHLGFADAETNPEAKAKFKRCAEIEEENAAFLDTLK